ncbi:protein FAM167A-like isoform X1 [Asterias amurensis]|uniref:protein FAM167A-like isoform X1 n=1 Tax=Asterias amurensis TaxID=7602 RepID=UPI003AB6402B
MKGYCGSMGPSQDSLPLLGIPIITVTPPKSPREIALRAPSFDLETIDETECSINYQQKRSSANLLPQIHEWSPPPLRRHHTPVHHNDELDSSCTSSDDEDELKKLKSMTKRLRLSTRRPSYVEWCENLPKMLDLNANTKKCDTVEDVGDDNISSYSRRINTVEENIKWVRKELIAMKSQDHRLAIQLMRLRSDIQQLKLQKSYHEYRELIDTATESAQEGREQQTPLCDLPFRRENGLLFALEKPLKDFGVTRLNLFARRFSLS